MGGIAVLSGSVCVAADIFLHRVCVFLPNVVNQRYTSKPALPAAMKWSNTVGGGGFFSRGIYVHLL